MGGVFNEPMLDIVTYTGEINGGPRNRHDEADGSRRMNLPSPLPGGGRVGVDVSTADTVDNEREVCLHDWKTQSVVAQRAPHA